MIDAIVEFGIMRVYNAFNLMLHVFNASETSQHKVKQSIQMVVHLTGAERKKYYSIIDGRLGTPTLTVFLPSNITTFYHSLCTFSVKVRDSGKQLKTNSLPTER